MVEPRFEKNLFFEGKNMRNLFLPLVILLATACGNDQRTTASSVKGDSSSVRVCMGKRVPSGYVITAHIHTLDCGSGSILQDNTNVIGKPSSVAVVCSDSPLPDGYVEIETLNSFDCRGGSILQDNAIKIRRL